MKALHVQTQTIIMLLYISNLDTEALIKGSIPTYKRALSLFVRTCCCRSIWYGMLYCFPKRIPHAQNSNSSELSHQLHCSMYGGPIVKSLKIVTSLYVYSPSILFLTCHAYQCFAYCLVVLFILLQTCLLCKPTGICRFG